MSPKILQYLYQFPDYLVWIPLYFDVAQIREPGETFGQNLIAMSGGLWKNVTGYDNFNGNLEKLVEDYRQEFLS